VGSKFFDESGTVHLGCDAKSDCIMMVRYHPTDKNVLKIINKIETVGAVTFAIVAIKFLS